MSHRTKIIFKVVGWSVTVTISIIGLVFMARQNIIIELPSTQTLPINISHEQSNELTPTFTEAITPSPSPEPPFESPKTSKTQLSDLENIASGKKIVFQSRTAKDNYGNEYREFYQGYRTLISDRPTYMVLLNGNYSRFQAIYYIKEGQSYDGLAEIIIHLDDTEILYETLDKTSKPINIDVDITGGNVFTLEIKGLSTLSRRGIESCLSDAFFIP
ncbi:MAG: hypothetical protein LBD23_04190 [Oscillospiraceae bacterium]|jgi:hypothetical protein|nr:hypothetical protein [Oscillospiraceae bacterium]